MVFEEVVLAGHGGKSSAGNIARSGCQSHFTAQDSVHLARSLSSNSSSSFIIFTLFTEQIQLNMT